MLGVTAELVSTTGKRPHAGRGPPASRETRGCRRRGSVRLRNALPLLPVALVAVALVACGGARASSASSQVRAASAAQAGDAPAGVRLDLDEADAALALIRAGGAASDSLWERLTASAGYRRLAERERSFGRPFTDSAFRAFLTSDTLVARAAALEQSVARWRTFDASEAAARAAAYLPAGVRLHATLYPVIKPRTNSFVFDLAGDPAIFVYVDPAVSAAALANTMAHELHHVGVALACRAAGAARESALARLRGDDSLRAAGAHRAATWAGAFAEGLAMLAAAGGPGVHPHAASADSARVRWDRDLADAPADVERLTAFFDAVLDGRLADPDEVARAAAEFYGVQGPWYTVGYLMAHTVETTFGRPRLLGLVCDPTALMAAYNEAARGSGRSLPLWPDALLGELRRAASG